MKTSQIQVEGDECFALDHSCEFDRLPDWHRENMRFLQLMSTDYPDIANWYLNKVMPGLRYRTRKIIQVHQNNELVAIGIGKKTSSEAKICTVRVSPEYVGRGFGRKIFDNLIEWLEVDHPFITVGESKLPCFEKIFSDYGFRLTSVRNGLYVPNRVELFFNEPMMLLGWRGAGKLSIER